MNEQRQIIEGISSAPLPRLLYTTAEALQMLGIKSEKTLNKHIRMGQLRYVLIGRSRRFDPADLREFIERSKVPWPSISATTVTTGGTTSPLKVVGLEAVRKQLAGKTRKS